MLTNHGKVSCVCGLYSLCLNIGIGEIKPTVVSQMGFYTRIVLYSAVAVMLSECPNMERVLHFWPLADTLRSLFR